MKTDIMYCFPGLPFTVDTTVTKIQVFYPIVPGAVYGEYCSSLGPNRKFFEPRDNLTILSFGVKMPYCFTFAEVIPYFQFVWFQNPNFAIIDEIADPTGQLNHPLPNTEIDINTFVPFMPPDPTNRTTIGIKAGQIDISMIGVPDELHNQELRFFPFIKVQHNLNLGV